MANGNGNVGSSQGEDSGSSRSRSKENKRRSFFGGVARSESSFDGGDGGDGDWFTDAGNDTHGRGRGRTMTSESSGGMSVGTGTVNSGGGAVGLGSRVGSVRKRLSMLKLGKKNSKANVLVDSVAEE
jgi:dedicator of cytokinesis protein 3